jgi:tetratricopeptide (TPR) repeat protein
MINRLLYCLAGISLCLTFCAPKVLHKAGTEIPQHLLSKSQVGQYMKMGTDLSDQNKYDAAAEMFEKIIDDDSMNGEALIHHGFACTRLEQYSNAIFDFSRVINNKTGDTAEAYMLRGTVYQNKGHYDSAIRDFNMYLNIKSHSIDSNNCFFRRASCYSDENKFDSALADLNRCSDGFEYKEYVYELRGDVFCRMGKGDRAASEYQKAFELYQQKNSTGNLDRIKEKANSPCSRPENTTSLQLKLDNAKPGDVITVPAGSYHDHVFIKNKDHILLVSSGGTAKMTGDQDKQPIIVIQNSRAITIDGFYLYYDGSSDSKQHIEIRKSDNICLKNCEFEKTEVNSVYISDSKQISFIKCRFHNCSSALTLWNVEGCEVTDCQFWENGFHYHSNDIEGSNSTGLVFNKINGYFPDNTPVSTEWLSSLKQHDLVPLFKARPFLVHGDFNGDGREEYALQSQRADFRGDTGIKIAIFSENSVMDTVRIPVNQNFEWSNHLGHNSSPDTIAVEFNSVHENCKGAIDKPKDGNYSFRLIR